MLHSPKGHFVSFFGAYFCFVSQAVGNQPRNVINRSRRLNLELFCPSCDIRYHAQYGAISSAVTDPRGYSTCPRAVDTILEPYPEASTVQARCISCSYVFKITTRQSQKFRKWLESFPPPRGLRNLAVSTDSD